MAEPKSETKTPARTKAAPEYDLESFDWRHPEDCRGKLDARHTSGWSVHTAQIGFPYLHVLWVRGG